MPRSASLRRRDPASRPASTPPTPRPLGAKPLAGAGLWIVYGGAQVGVMGALADAALSAAGGEVVGVILRHHGAQLEVAHEGLTRLHVVGSMHERKALMAELAEGFVAMPGGLGTLEELAEILTWYQLGLHAKPVGLLDPRGYFDHLLGFLDHAVDQGFVQPGHRLHCFVRRSAWPKLLGLMNARLAPG